MPCAGTGRTSAPGWCSRSRPNAPGRAARHDALVHQLHPMLDAADAVGVFEKSRGPLLPVLETERAVVGATTASSFARRPRHRLSCGARPCRIAAVSSRPISRPRTPAGPACPQRQPQVLRTGLGEHVRPSCLAAAISSSASAADMCTTYSGSCPRPSRARSRGAWPRPPAPRARVAVVHGVGIAAGQRLCHQHVDRDPVLGVHHDHGAALGGRLHRPQVLPIVAVEDAGVRHEQLEAGHALMLGEVFQDFTPRRRPRR